MRTLVSLLAAFLIWACGVHTAAGQVFSVDPEVSQQEPSDDVAPASIEKDTRGMYLSFGGGSWIPAGANGILGNKAEVGLGIGGQSGRREIGIAVGIRFLKAAEPYEVKYGNELRTTQDYLGGYIGALCSYDVIRAGRFGTNLLVMLAFEGLDAIDGGDKEDSKSINSLGISFSVTERIYYDKFLSGYLGLQVRYTIVDYDSGGGSDLSGNTISVNLVWGQGVPIIVD